MRGVIRPLSNTPSWRGAQLKHRDNFTFLRISYHNNQGNATRTRYSGIQEVSKGILRCFISLYVRFFTFIYCIYELLLTVLMVWLYGKNRKAYMGRTIHSLDGVKRDQKCNDYSGFRNRWAKVVGKFAPVLN
jgi:hypothetical protein